jgi:holliday junction DNA helicase RuvA
MLAYLEGTLLYKDGDSWIVKSGCVGYRVCIPQGLHGAGHPGQAMVLWIESLVHDGAFTFFGFTDLDELRWFRWLVAVPGVGGKMAAHILAGLSPDDLAQAITAEQTRWLRQVDGVGPKLASRLITELAERARQWEKNKVLGLQTSPATPTSAPTSLSSPVDQETQPASMAPQKSDTALPSEPGAPNVSPNVSPQVLPQVSPNGLHKVAPKKAALGQTSPPQMPERARSSHKTEAILALEALGYSYKQAQQAVTQVIAQANIVQSTAQLIQAGLALLTN